MQEVLTCLGIGDERSLVADDRVGEPTETEVRPHRLEHPARRDEHVNAGVARRGDRAQRAGRELGVSRDQRPVEIADECLDVRRKAGGKREGRLAQWPAIVDTYCATSAICLSFNLPLNDGITPLPSVTRSTTSWNGGLRSSRLGPTVPVAFASFSV